MKQQTPTGATQTATCPNCGMSKSMWTENKGQGYTKDGETYCCRGCAEGTGCTCRRGEA